MCVCVCVCVCVGSGGGVGWEEALLDAIPDLNCYLISSHKRTACLLACLLLWSFWVLEKETKWSGVCILINKNITLSFKINALNHHCLVTNVYTGLWYYLAGYIRLQSSHFSYSFYATLSSSDLWNNDLKRVQNLKILWLTTLFSTCMYFCFFHKTCPKLSLFSLFFSYT